MSSSPYLSSFRDRVPLMCVETNEKTTGRKLFVKFSSSKDVEYPPVDFDDDKCYNEALKSPTLNYVPFKIPLSSSPIFWTKDGKRNYVIEIVINSRFATRRVINSKLVVNFVIEASLLAIEEKYNLTDNPRKTTSQFIGHKVDLDFRAYKILPSSQKVEASPELAINKVTPLDELNLSKAPDLPQYDLYYRPQSKLLTCSLLTGELPKSVSFNDERIVVETGDIVSLDIQLPFFIDIREPMQYRFYEKAGLFKAIFKVSETPC